MKWDKHYCYCPSCPDFKIKAATLHEAKESLETHEKECHKGKPCGTFGSGTSYPKDFNKSS